MTRMTGRSSPEGHTRYTADLSANSDSQMRLSAEIEGTKCACLPRKKTSSVFRGARQPPRQSQHSAECPYETGSAYKRLLRSDFPKLLMEEDNN